MPAVGTCTVAARHSAQARALRSQSDRYRSLVGAEVALCTRTQETSQIVSIYSIAIALLTPTIGRLQGADAAVGCGCASDRQPGRLTH
jgi:hypothetical protein